DRFVYVTGLVSKPGLVSFLPSEEMTLSKALAKAGGVPSGDTDRVDRIIVKRRNGNIARLDWEEVLSGATDASLEIGDTVMVEKVKERYIYVLGDNPQRNGKMVFEPKEAFTLAVALKKYGIEDVALLDKVELIRKGKAVSIPPDRALFDERELLVGDTVVVKMKDSTRIYITGDVFAYVTFNPEENPTLNKALAKAGGFDERYLKGLKIVKKDGETVLLKKVVPFELDDGDVIEVDLYETSRIYVGGFVKSPGLVVFQPDEEPSLKKALARAGGVLETEDNVADKAVIVRNGERKSYNVESILLGEIDVVLQDGDYITVTWRNLRYAFAFGEGVRNGKVIFKDEEEFNVKNLLGKVGGLNEKASKKIEVIMPNGDTQTINFEDVLKGGGPELENGAMVLIPEETEDYVYVLGEVRSPGAYRLKGDVRLYQVISWAGGLSDWAAKTKVVLKRGGEEKEYDMDDLSSVEGVKILPGDVVYVPPIETNIVYVFGEVNRPSIVRIDRYSTVFDAVMKSGGFTKDAAYSKVFLFKGGSEKDAVICDLSGMVTGKGGFVNPSVGPGDIIYVSRSPTMELPEVIAVVKNLMDIISTSKSILGW
ncbi:MAG: polysaccharide biosynthesis/export protein, partial [Thermotogota bacterium]|nr:polysaccharide biosynthesis/export protein [Thermotogota bacterium]